MRNTGAVIVRRFRTEGLDPVAVPGVLVAGHAPFAWGKSSAEAVEHADVLEYIARLAFRTVLLNPVRHRFPTHVSRTSLPAQARTESHLWAALKVTSEGQMSTQRRLASGESCVQF